MTKPPMELQVFMKMIQSRLDAGKPLFLQSSIRGKITTLAVKSVSAEFKPEALDEDDDLDDAWYVRVEAESGYQPGATEKTRYQESYTNNQMAHTVFSPVGDALVIHKGWRQPMDPYAKLDEGLGEPILPRIVTAAAVKSAHGGEQLMYLRPSHTDTFTLHKIASVHNLDAMKQGGRVYVQGALTFKYLLTRDDPNSAVGLDIVKSPDMDDEWTLTPKTIGDDNFIILHRNTEEANDFVEKHLKAKHLR